MKRSMEKGRHTNVSDAQALRELIEILKKPYQSHCDRCGGTGVIRGRGDCCPTCGGSGKIVIDLL